MGTKSGPEKFTFFSWLFGRGVLKRTILVPLYALLAVAFALSWLLSVRVSRSAVLHAADALALSAAERAVAELHERLSLPAAIVESNAALLATSPRPLVSGYLDALPGAFAAQLEVYPSIDLISVGFSDGEYAEAQRIADTVVRLGRAGASTGGALSLYRIGEDGRATEEVRKEDYDPRLRPWYRAALGRSELYWSGPYAYVSSGELAIAAVKLIKKPNGSTMGVSQASLRLSDFSNFMGSMEELEGGFGALVARDGSVIAAGGTASDFTSFLSSVIDAKAGSERLVRRETYRGSRFRVVSIPCAEAHNLSWSVTVAVPEARFLAPLRSNDANMALIFSASFLAALGLAYLIAASLAEPLRLLSSAAAELGATPLPLTLNSELRRTLQKISLRGDEIGRLAAAFERLDSSLAVTFASLKSSLAEKEVLLREVHHRVKNNLQIVSSLLSLRAGDLNDPVLSSHLEEIRDRVHAMSLVHETIYSSGEFAAVPMDDYLLRVVRSLSAFDRVGASISLSVQATGVGLPLEKAIPCALVVVELATNAFKHAFTGRESGKVVVSLSRKDDSLLLSITDDGIGMCDGLMPGGMGSTIVEALAAQLGGGISVETGSGGTCVTLSFPAPAA